MSLAGQGTRRCSPPPVAPTTSAWTPPLNDLSLLEISAASPEAYVDAAREHPTAMEVWPIFERAGLLDSLREEMMHELAAGNEGAAELLIRSPYVVHELRRPPEPD